MPREVASPRKAESVYVFLSPVVRHAYSERHGLLRAPKLKGYCYQTLVTTGRNRRPERYRTTHQVAAAMKVLRPENANIEASFP